MEYSLAIGLEKLCMPLLVAKVNGAALTFIIDTGATHNTVASFVYEQLSGGFTLSDKENKVMGIEGNYHSTPVVEAVLYLDDTPVRTEFSVVDMNDAVMQIQNEVGLQIHGFLGIPFLIENKCVLDFEKKTIVINKQ